MSWLGLLVGVVWIAAAERLGIIASALRNPFVPLLVSLACALAFVALSADPGRIVRRARVIVWLSVIAATLLVAALFAFRRWAAIVLYPVGDHAILEIYTLHAVRGVWTLGPYSQFGWHHPGPLCFYLLAPFYVLSGEQTIGLHVGAFAINLLSLCAISYTLIRHAAPCVAGAAILALGAYLLRLEPIISSYWNPHIVIVPAALYFVLTAAVATGRAAALLGSVPVGSFLIQTHISLSPYVLVLGIFAVISGGWQRTQTPHGSGKRWVQASAGLFALLWLLPIVEQVSHSPGNLSRIVEFFGGPSPGQDVRTAVIVWGDLICALFQTPLDVPEGLPLRISDQGITSVSILAIVQLLLLIVASVDAVRRKDRFDAALTTFGFLASIVGLWSLTRVRSLIGDYTIFWLSAIGTLNWAIIAGLIVRRIVGVRLPVLRQGVALSIAGIVLWSFLDLGGDQLRRVRRQALRPPSDSATAVRLASDAILEDMRLKQIRRPLFQMNTRDWTTAAGVLLQVYKRRTPLAVDRSLVSLFGEPLTPAGDEDRVFVIADAAAHAGLSQQPGDDMLIRVDRMYIHARPAVTASTRPTKR